jgi:aldehyde:ferredoxin oxidoreductase
LNFSLLLPPGEYDSIEKGSGRQCLKWHAGLLRVQAGYLAMASKEETMKNLGGTVLHVDLSSGKIEKKPIEEDLRADYVGGRGINVRLLFDETAAGIDPLSPENRLIIGAGLFSGTSAPCAARFNVTTKSPLTGIVGDANGGGHFGPALRRAGVDHIVFKGKADEPVYLWIDDGKVEIRSARTVWGKDIREAEELIKEELGDRRVRVAAIGQAGENLVRIANVVSEERSASRCGVGAVMGSKNLKAVAARGSQEVPLFDPDGFNRLAKELQKRVAGSKHYDGFRTRGGSAGTFATDKVGFLAVRNFQQAGGFEKIDAFNPENLAPKYYSGRVHCYGCPIGCGHKFKVKDGPYAGEWGNKVEEGAFTPLGPVCGNADIPSILKMNNMTNQLGIDLIEFGQAMAVVMEWYEKGIVSAEDLDGIPLTWGNHEGMVKMLEKIAFRQGVGDILSDGIVLAAKKFGKEAEKYVCHAKGMVMAGIEIRMLKGTALGFATSTRGACHNRALVPVEFSGFPVMTPEQAEERFGTKEVLNANSYKKAAPLIYYQHLYILRDLFETCTFLLGLGTGTRDFTYDDLYKLYSLATGIKADEEHMLTIAERIWNLERAYSCREGMGRKEDHLSGKWVNEPIQSGANKGETLDPEKWEVMLDEYYELRGWDKDGVPTPEKLKELGLDDVIGQLRK